MLKGFRIKGQLDYKWIISIISYLIFRGYKNWYFETVPEGCKHLQGTDASYEHEIDFDMIDFLELKDRFYERLDEEFGVKVRGHITKPELVPSIFDPIIPWSRNVKLASFTKKITLGSALVDSEIYEKVKPYLVDYDITVWTKNDYYNTAGYDLIVGPIGGDLSYVAASQFTSTDNIMESPFFIGIETVDLTNITAEERDILFMDRLWWELFYAVESDLGQLDIVLKVIQEMRKCNYNFHVHAKEIFKKNGKNTIS